MAVTIYKSLWGMSGADAIERIASAGYDGVEGAIVEIQDVKEFQQQLSDFNLSFIPLIYTEGSGINEHFEAFERLIELSATFTPSKIVAHAGRDKWPLNDQLQLFEAALRIEETIGIPIAHETHRRRPLYSPMNCFEIISRLPEIKITADLSHWCCVTESMLEEYDSIIESIIARTIHIHSRVGYENGPQVSDPRSPQWAGHLMRFESWWKQMILTNEDSSITPEYGPPTYMQTMPDSNEAVADLWEVCLWSAERMRLLSQSQ